MSKLDMEIRKRIAARRAAARTSLSDEQKAALLDRAKEFAARRGYAQTLFLEALEELLGEKPP